MNPAEKFAALQLLSHGLQAALDEAKAEAMAYARHHRAKSLETDYGSVGLTRKKPTVRITDEGAFLAWCRENAPSEIVESVRPSFVTAFKKQILAEPHGLIYGLTGEEVDFVDLVAGYEFLSVRLTGEAKRDAEEYVALNLGQLLPPATASPKICVGGAGSSSDRRPRSRSPRRWDWSTTTSTGV